MTELMLQENGYTLAEMAEALGSGSTSAGPSIPSLQMNYDGENGPMGAFYLKMGKAGNCQDNAYATENVRFRALSSHVQWQHWVDNELANKSLLVKNMRSEARDQLGGVRCSLPDYDDLWALTDDQRAAHSGKEKYRVVRGLVSYTGKTPDGREVTYENHPCIFSGKRKNYGKFYDDVVSKMPQKMEIWDFESILSKQTVTNSYQKKYYIMRFAPQYSNKLEVDQVIVDSINHVLGLVLDENKKIEELYKSSMRGKSVEDTEDLAVAALESVDVFDSDFV